MFLVFKNWLNWLQEHYNIMEIYAHCNIIFLIIPDTEKIYQHFITEFNFFYNFVIYYNM